jgi:OOP family OmpA-OmpF porin
MTIRTILLGSAAIALGVAATTAPAQATQLRGWYVGIEGGANWVKDWTFTSSNGTHNHEFDANFESGWAVLGTVGYDFNHWRIELEAGYRHNEVENFSTFGLPFPDNDASLSELTLMANILYDINLTDRLSLALGAGAGGDKVDLEFGAIQAADIDEWRFAYQGIAGFNYALSRRWDLALNYRYLHVDAPEIPIGPFNGHAFTSADDIEKHTVTLGLRYSFGREEEEAAPPPPPPPAMPPPPPAHFVIFFGFNKCNITSEADAVLSEAAAAAKSTGSASVKIVGHTDSVGSPKYNQKLSECRANAAASNLTGKGVPAGAISTSGKGETELMVQTGDGVKEPQNRRATVDLN